MNITAIRSDWVGRVIDERFTLLQWLGGSEGSGVFLTEVQGHPPQKAAIKIISADGRDAEASIADWTATTTLSHPHLMRLFHSGRYQIDTTPLLYVVTEYAEEVLSQILLDRPLTIPEAGELLDPVLDALSYLHGKGLVHGHLKPSNIMVVDNQLKLSSDSISLAGKPGKHVSAPGVYDAPETATEAIFPSADVWSLGVTLVEALTQHPPVWDRLTQKDPIVPESVPQPYAEIAQGCLRSNPARRSTLGNVKTRLDPSQSLSVSGSKADRIVSAKLRLTALVAAGLVLLAVIATMALRSHKTRSSQQTEEQLPMPAVAAPLPQSAVSGAQTTKGLTVKGAVTDRVLPDLLPSAIESIRGQVNVGLRVMVDSRGNVSNATFDSPGPSKYFAKVALQAAQRWKFKPAQVDGQAVSSVWILQFQFTQGAAEVTPIESSP